jgi:hypothetical protein
LHTSATTRFGKRSVGGSAGAQETTGLEPSVPNAVEHSSGPIRSPLAIKTAHCGVRTQMLDHKMNPSQVSAARPPFGTALIQAQRLSGVNALGVRKGVLFEGQSRS